MTSSDDDELITQQANEVSADEMASAYQRWQAPTMVSVTDIEEGYSMLTVDDIDKLQQQAEAEGHQQGFDKGYQQGLKSGLEAAQQEIDKKVLLLEQIAENLNSPLEDLDQQIEHDIISLVMTMTRQLVRRELKTQPDNVIAAVRAALAVLPINDRKLKLYIHPQDVDIVKKGLSLDQDDSSWKWIEDPLLSRGGVRIETADTRIDATVEARLQSVISTLLGEERIDDSAQ